MVLLNSVKCYLKLNSDKSNMQHYFFTKDIVNVVSSQFGSLFVSRDFFLSGERHSFLSFLRVLLIGDAETSFVSLSCNSAVCLSNK